MKLYLSSYRLGNKTDELIKWKKEHNNKIALIADARDAYHDSERKQLSIMIDVKTLEDLGFEVSVIWLKDYFNNNKKLIEKLKQFNAFIVIGGDVFILRQAMNFSGFDIYLKEIANRENILYAGYSAGICVLAPNLKGLELVGEPENIPYGKNFIFEGLGLIDFVPVPHFKSDHLKSKEMNEVVKYFKKEKINYKTLRDGDVIIQNTQKIKEL